MSQTETQAEPKTEIVDPYGSVPSPEKSQVLQNLLNLPPTEIRALTADLKKVVTEDYTASKIEASVVDEIPEVITTLTDIVSTDKDGNLIVTEDERGNWIDIIGAKGNIPSYFMPFNQRANFSSIFLRLHHGCYEIEYQTNPDGSIYRENGKPIILSKKCTSIAVSLRNLNQMCMLALNANRPILQAKIFGGLKGGTPLGYEGNFDKMVFDLMGKKK